MHEAAYKTPLKKAVGGDPEGKFCDSVWIEWHIFPL